MRILVVDDEKIKRVTLAHDIESQGHEVVTAVDGAEALEKLQASHFDVVVTDHHQVPPSPPAARALVNPWAAGSSYPFPHLSGVGVAFKLAWAVSQKLSKSKKLSQEYREFLLESLSLTALGTIKLSSTL